MRDLRHGTLRRETAAESLPVRTHVVVFILWEYYSGCLMGYLLDGEKMTVKFGVCYSKRELVQREWCSRVMSRQLSPLHESGVQRERTLLKTPTYDFMQVDSTQATGAPGIPRRESRITEAAVLEPKSPKREEGRRRRSL